MTVPNPKYPRLSSGDTIRWEDSEDVHKEFFEGVGWMPGNLYFVKLNAG